MKLWIVWGEQGQYSDHSVWIVAIYDNQEMAEKHVELAKDYYERLKNREDRWESTARNPFDSSWRGGYDNVWYSCNADKLSTELPQIDAACFVEV